MILKRCEARLAFLAGCVCLTAALFTQSHAAEGKFRSWADSTGKFKITARFVSLDQGTVTLEQEDGSELEVELKSLTAADQKFVADAVKNAASPFKTKSKPADPFKPKAK